MSRQILRFCIAIPLLAVLSSAAKITVTPATSAGENTTEVVLESFLGDNSIEVMNAKVSGDARQFGVFVGGLEAIGFQRGLVLSTGDVSSIKDSNKRKDVTGILYGSGDDDLQKYSKYHTKDSASLTFEFVPATADISFSYVFASDEYPEFAPSTYNDIFALEINQKNCAVLPNGGGVVSINNVNGKGSNSMFYRDNTDASIPIEFDGLTTVLQIICEDGVRVNEVNTLKIVIADVHDFSYDSAVFLMEHSFGDEICFDGIDNNQNGMIDEGCPDMGTVVDFTPVPTATATASAEEEEELVRCEERSASGGRLKWTSEGCFVVPATSVYTADMAGSVCCRREEGTHGVACDPSKPLVVGEMVCCNKEDTIKLIPTGEQGC